jgi:hypothetical protein
VPMTATGIRVQITTHNPTSAALYVDLGLTRTAHPSVEKGPLFNGRQAVA